jgi:hypothetical protein
VVRTETDASKSPSLESLMASRRVDAWILCLPESEDDPNETFLRLDWRFRGAIARALRAGAISRESGAVSFLPCTRPVSDSGRKTFRILTLGVRDRENITSQELARLVQNIDGLGLKSVGISASDFGWSAAEAKRHFPKNGADLCVIG